MKSHALAIVLGIVVSLSVSAADYPFPGVAPTREQTPYYPFTQAGYGAGTVYGWFYGTDANADGYLTTSELQDFQFSFFANDGSSFQSLAVPVDQMFTTGGFRFRIGGSLLGDDAGEFVAAGGTATNGFSLVADSNGGIFSSPAGFPVGVVTTHELLQVLPLQVIPEPAVSTLTLAGLGLTALFVRRRKQRSDHLIPGMPDSDQI